MKYLILLLMTISFSVMLSFASVQEAECIKCGGFCSGRLDCPVGCKCVGHSSTNQGVCRSFGY